MNQVKYSTVSYVILVSLFCLPDSFSSKSFYLFNDNQGEKNSNKHYKSKIIPILNYKDAQTNLLILIPFKIVILIQMDGKGLNIHHCSKFHIPPTPAMKERHK